MNAMPRLHVPIVGGLGYQERIRRLPPQFRVRLVREPQNRYFPGAVAVLASGEKVGYLPPEVAGEWLPDDGGAEYPARLVTSPGRRFLGVLLELDSVE